MSDKSTRGGGPGRNPAGQADRTAREKRLAQALRDNLARRKAQVRARDDDANAGGDGNPKKDG